jgi:phenylacetic acid degradation protein
MPLGHLVFVNLSSGGGVVAFYEFEGKVPYADPEAFVHPEAVLIGDVIVDRGGYIGAGAVLRGDIGYIRVGRGSNVQENCVIHTFPDKPATLHPDVHVGHGCVLHGCEICSMVLVGMGSIVSDGVKINSRCLIGAGSFVPFGMEIPENSLVMGSPARVVKEISREQLERISNGLSIYQDLTRRHLKSLKRLPDRE